MMESCKGCIDERKQDVFHSCKVCKEAPVRVNYMTKDKTPTVPVYCEDCAYALNLWTIGSAGMGGYRYFCERTKVIKDSPIKQYEEWCLCEEKNPRNGCIDFKPKKPWWKFWA